ncbi:MAG: TolC family protein, partial [Methylobacter sp.]
MFFIICSWPIRCAYPVWATLAFWLAAFLPGPVFNITIGTVHMGWATALAETPDISTNDSVLTLDQAVQHALSGNPGLAKIRARAEAMAAVPSQEGTLPDPSLRFGALYLPTNNFSLRQDDFTMLEVGLSQEIPFPGKLALREKIAGQEALAAADSVDEARLRLVREVKQSWWRLFYYNRALNLLDEAERFFQQLIDIAQAKYKVGKGTQQEVLLAQLELSKLKEGKLDLVSMRHGQNARINALMDRTPETTVQIPVEAEFKLPVIVESALQEKALKIRALFAQHRKMLDAALARVDLAQKGFYPDFIVGAFYDVRQNTPSGQLRSD